MTAFFTSSISGGGESRSTLPAYAMAFGVEVNVSARQLMPLFAMGLASVDASESIGASQVSCKRYGFEMIGVNAGRIDAKVIQRQLRRDRADAELISPSMGKSIKVSPALANTELPISHSVFAREEGTTPDPARPPVGITDRDRACKVDLCPEPRGVIPANLRSRLNRASAIKARVMQAAEALPEMDSLAIRRGTDEHDSL